MRWIYSADGTTVDKTHKLRPAEHWQQTSVDPPQGQYVKITNANANSLGYYELQEPAAPSPDHVRSIERAGDDFTVVWTFDQATADSNSDGASRDADAVALRDDLALAIAERDDAALERAEMLLGDPAFLPKWNDVDDTDWVPLALSGQTNSKLQQLEDAINQLGPRVVDQAKLVNLHTNKIRKIWGSVRILSAMLVRKLRKDRDDVA